jgi:hypothetical protein
MPNPPKDPVRAVKAWIRRGEPLRRSDAEVKLADELRELEARLFRARQIEVRVGPSEALEALLRPGGPVVP